MSIDLHGQHVRTFSRRLVRTVDTSLAASENRFPTVYHFVAFGRQWRVPWIVWAMRRGA